MIMMFLMPFTNKPNDPSGPRLAVVKITTDNPPRALPNVDGIYVKTTASAMAWPPALLEENKLDFRHGLIRSNLLCCYVVSFKLAIDVLM